MLIRNFVLLVVYEEFLIMDQLGYVLFGIKQLR